MKSKNPNSLSLTKSVCINRLYVTSLRAINVKLCQMRRKWKCEELRANIQENGHVLFNKHSSPLSTVTTTECISGFRIYSLCVDGGWATVCYLLESVLLSVCKRQSVKTIAIRIFLSVCCCCYCREYAATALAMSGLKSFVPNKSKIVYNTHNRNGSVAAKNIGHQVRSPRYPFVATSTHIIYLMRVRYETGIIYAGAHTSITLKYFYNSYYGWEWGWVNGVNMGICLQFQMRRCVIQRRARHAWLSPWLPAQM